jgi:hypothetical protein
MGKKRIVVFISLLLARTLYKVVKDYAYNKTVSDYLEQKQQK